MDNSLNNQGISFHQTNQPNQKSKPDNKAPEDPVKDYINAMGAEKLINTSEALLKEMGSLLDSLIKAEDKNFTECQQKITEYRHKTEKGLKVDDNSFYKLSVFYMGKKIDLTPPEEKMSMKELISYLSSTENVLRTYVRSKSKNNVHNAAEAAGKNLLGSKEMNFTRDQKKDIEKKIEESVINIEFGYDDDKNPQRKLHLKHVGPQCEDMRDFLKTSTDSECSRAILQQQEQERRQKLSARNSDADQTSVLRAYDSDSPSQKAASVGEEAETIQNESVETVISTDKSGKKRQPWV